MQYDIVFLHPPSSFSKIDYPLGGVFAAQTGTTDFFVGMPVGLVNMAHQLLKNRYTAKIINIAEYLKTYRAKFDLDAFIDQLDARGYGIDLHWAVHTPGALDLARLVKEKKGDSFVFLGGLTASYFCDEILENCSHIDGIMRGECDDSIVGLASELSKAKRDFSRVPNLAYRQNGAIIKNKVSLPELVDFNFYDYYSIVEPTPVILRHMMLPVIRGCMQNCPFCGGSSFSYGTFFQRKKPIALPPEKVSENIKNFARRGGQYVNLLGDIRCAGSSYVDELFSHIRKVSHKVSIKNELFYPGDYQYLKKWSENAEVANLVLSPESADPEVMRAVGKNYTPDDVEQQVVWCNELNIDLTLSFLYALPYQTMGSLMSTMGFIEKMFNLPHSRAGFMIEPMLFIDPACMIFEDPEKWGYKIDFRSLADIDGHLRMSHWSYALGYSTKWMSKEEITDACFLVSEKAAALYYDRGEMSSDAYQKTRENISLNKRIILEKRRDGNLPSEQVATLIRSTFPAYLLDDNGLIKYSFE